MGYPPPNRRQGRLLCTLQRWDLHPVCILETDISSLNDRHGVPATRHCSCKLLALHRVWRYETDHLAVSRTYHGPDRRRWSRCRSHQCCTGQSRKSRPVLLCGGVTDTNSLYFRLNYSRSRCRVRSVLPFRSLTIRAESLIVVWRSW
jgi:hypothetical protein